MLEWCLGCEDKWHCRAPFFFSSLLSLLLLFTSSFFSLVFGARVVLYIQDIWDFDDVTRIAMCSTLGVKDGGYKF